MGLFNQFPFTNFHEMNLDWVISEIQKLGNKVDNFSNELQNYVYEYLDKWVHDNEIDVAGLTNGEVNINAFTPHGDGVTDDKDAFNNAIDFCNKYGLNLALNPTNYYISAPLNNMQNSIDGRGATIIPGTAHSSSEHIFNFVSDSENITVPASAFTSTTVSDSRLFGKVFHLVSDVDIGERGTAGYHKVAEQTVITDKLGNIINSQLGFTPVSICTCNFVRTATAGKHLYNINYIIEKNSDYILGLANITMDFFEIKNINISGFITSSNFVGDVISMSYCTNCVIKNVKGSGIVNKSGSGYIIGISAGSNNRIINCNLGNDTIENWGNIGCNYLTNTEFYNVISNRIDCHYMSFGYLNINSCCAQLITLPEGGYGEINIEKTIFTGNSYNYIQKRKEMPIIFAGNVTINNCIGNTEKHLLLDYELKNSNIITENLINKNSCVFVKNCNFSNGLRELIRITDFNKISIYCFVENCSIKTIENLPIIRLNSDGDMPVYMYYKNCIITGNNCKYFGDIGRENIIFENCRIEVSVTACNANNNITVANSYYKQSGTAITANRFIFYGNTIFADIHTRNITANQSKFFGNIAINPDYTVDWND